MEAKLSSAMQSAIADIMKPELTALTSDLCRLKALLDYAHSDMSTNLAPYLTKEQINMLDKSFVDYSSVVLDCLLNLARLNIMDSGYEEI